MPDISLSIFRSVCLASFIDSFQTSFRHPKRKPDATPPYSLSSIDLKTSSSEASTGELSLKFPAASTPIPRQSGQI
jgi:hypothetical protein